MPHEGAPSMGQWVSYTRSRPAERLQRCVRCTVEVPWTDRQPRRAVGETRLARYRRSGEDLSTIRVGALVKKWEEVETIDPDTGDVIDIQLKKRIVPMMLRGLGCASCQWDMAIADAESKWESEVAPAETRSLFVRDTRVYDSRGIALHTQEAQHHRPQIREVKILVASVRGVRTPFIDVAGDVARCPGGVKGDVMERVVTVLMPSGPQPLERLNGITQAHLLREISERTAIRLLLNEEAEENLRRAAEITAHVAFRADEELKRWRVEWQRESATR